MTTTPVTEVPQAVPPVQPEPVTAPLITEQPSPVTPVVPDAPPTLDAGAQPVPPPASPDYSGLTVEQLENIPAYQTAIQQREAAIREQAERQAQTQVTTQRQQWYQRGGYIRNLESHLQDAVANQRAVDPNYVESVVDQMWLATSQEGYSAIDRVLQGVLPGDMQITQADMQALDRVRSEVLAGSKPLDALVSARWDQAVKSYAEHVLKPQLMTQLRQEQASQAQTNQMRANEEQRAQTPQPTLGVPGAAGGGAFRSQQEVRQAHVDGRISDAEMRDWKNSGRLEALPLTTV